MQTVLVTGGSGFIGSHAILQLLAAGYSVRASLRNPSREPEARAMLEQAGAEQLHNLTFFQADLNSDHGWAGAATGCDYVLHIASPFPFTLPKHEDELVIPARQGTLRVLRAARDADVKRVVLTSSFAAIGYGHKAQQAPFDERNWTDLSSEGMTPYVKSKTLAEKAAWDFMAREAGSMEFSVINPVAVFGPVLGADYSTSIIIVQRLLDGAMPGVPRLWLGAVDARDVADLHLRAMTAPAAKGERFLAVAGDFLSFLDIAHILKARMGEMARKVPSRQLLDWLIRLAALADPSVRQVLPELGIRKNATGEKARRMLGWTPRSNEEAIIATAESLVQMGLLSGRSKRAA